jgi:DNA-binding NarL/FixJ family response regulator
MAEPKIRALIADDHPVVHRGLDGLLFADPRILMVSAATSFDELLERLADTPIDVVVLDLSGMGLSPLMMVRVLRARFPQVGVLIFSSSLALAPELLGAGALGYVVKEEVLDHLPAAIVAVAAGQTYLSPLVQAALDRANAMGRELPLAPQELLVLKFVALAWKPSQIADELAIDPRTAQNYITKLLNKTGCESRAELAAWYRRYYEGATE